MMTSNGNQMPIITSDRNELRRCIMHLWPSYDGLGLVLKNSKNEISTPHMVKDVDVDSPAQYAGVLSGDYIIKVGNKSVEDEKFDNVLKLIKEQLKKEKKVDLLLINSAYFTDFRRRHEINGRKIDYNDPQILSQIKYYESPINNPNAPLSTIKSKGNPSLLSASNQNINTINHYDSPPEPRLCHLLNWSHYDGYGFFVAYNNDGCYVKNVEPNSPAQLGGLRPYDRIIEINGKVVHPKDKDAVMKEIAKHKKSQMNLTGSTSKLNTIRSQSAYSIGTTKSNRSSSDSNYLNLLVADPNTYKWLTDKKVDISTKNKSLKIQECFTPSEHSLLNLMHQRSQPDLSQISQVSTFQSQANQIKPLVNQADLLKSILMKSIIVRRLKGKEDQPLGFEMTKRGTQAHYISRVEAGSSAALSGLCVNDYLIELNDKNIEKDENSILREKIFKSLEPQNGGEFRLLTINKPGYDYCIDNNISPSNFIQLNKQSVQYFETPRDLSAIYSSSSRAGTPQLQAKQENTNTYRPVTPSSVIISSVVTDPNVGVTQGVNNSNTVNNNNLQNNINNQIQKKYSTIPRLCIIRKTPETNELGLSIARIKNVNEHIINDVVPGSLAEKAGIKPNDCLLEVNGVNVENISHVDTVNRIIDLARQPTADISLLVVERSQPPKSPDTSPPSVTNVIPGTIINNNINNNTNGLAGGTDIKIINDPNRQTIDNSLPKPSTNNSNELYSTVKSSQSNIVSDTIISTVEKSITHREHNIVIKNDPKINNNQISNIQTIRTNQDLPSINSYPEIKVCEFLGYPTGTQLGLVVTSDDYSHDVIKVAEDSPAYKAGIRKTDVIIAVNDINVEGNPSAIELLNNFSETKPLKILVASRYAYEWSNLLRIRITEKDWPNIKKYSTKYLPLSATSSNTFRTVPVTNSIYSQSNYYEPDNRISNGNNYEINRNSYYRPTSVTPTNSRNYNFAVNNNQTNEIIPSIYFPNSQHYNSMNNLSSRRIMSSTSTVRSAQTDQLSHFSTLSRSAVDITADGKVLRLCTLILDPTSPNPTDCEFGFDLVAKVGGDHRAIGDYFIDTVDDNSPANTSGLKPGDRLIEVDGIDLKNKTFEQVVDLINAAKQRSKLKLLVYPSVVINYGNPINDPNLINQKIVQHHQFSKPYYETQIPINLAYNDNSRSLPDLTIQQQQQQAIQPPQDYMNRQHYDFSKNLVYKNKKSNPYSSNRQYSNEYDSIYAKRPGNYTGTTNLSNNYGLSKSTSNIYGSTNSASTFNIENLVHPGFDLLRPSPRLCTVYKNDPLHLNNMANSSPNIGFGVHTKPTSSSVPNYLRLSIVNYKSPAYLSGLEAGDFIVQINGRNTLPVSHEEALHFIKSSYEMSNYVRLLVVSEFCYNWLKEHDLLHTLNTDNQSVFSYSEYLKNNHRYVPRLCKIKLFPFSKSFGFNIETLLIRPSSSLVSANKAAAYQSYAHIVVKVDRDSPAYTSSLQKGDRIIECDGINVEAENERQITDRIYQAFVSAKQISLFVVDPDTDNFFKSKCIKLHSMLPIVQHITNSTDI